MEDLIKAILNPAIQSHVFSFERWGYTVTFKYMGNGHHTVNMGILGSMSNDNPHALVVDVRHQYESIQALADRESADRYFDDEDEEWDIEPNLYTDCDTL